MELNQVTVPCVDYDASVAFYRALGLRQIVASPPRYSRFECDNGATLSLHAVDRPPQSPGVVVYLEVADLDRRVRELQAAGLTFESEPSDQRWLWREAYLRDPAGNRICLFTAGENRRFPPWRLETAAAEGSELRVELFEDRHAAAFQWLNLQWIEELLTVEDEDRAVLDHPRANVIDPGGQVLSILRGEQVVGACALLPVGPRRFELAKMAVAPAERGRGVGAQLLRAALAWARRQGAQTVFLRSHRSLQAALALYRKFGFRDVELPASGGDDSRCDVAMELDLTATEVP